MNNYLHIFEKLKLSNTITKDPDIITSYSEKVYIISILIYINYNNYYLNARISKQAADYYY